MDNNENNVQNQVQDESKKSNGGKAKGFVVTVLLIMCLGIGVGVGVLLAQNGNPFDKNGGNNVTNNTATNNVVETKSGKKIDESKPWVYNLEIQGKQVGSYNTADYLKVPYININSDDAKKVNTKIQEIYESSEKEFIKEKETNKDATVSLRYEKTENDKYVSIIISKGFGYENGSGSTIEEFAYTFNTETLKLVSFDEIIKDKQYSKENVDKTISKSVDKTKETIKNGPYSEDAQVSFNNDFYVDNNGKIKILVSVKDTAWENKIRNIFIEYSIDGNQEEENINITENGNADKQQNNENKVSSNENIFADLVSRIYQGEVTAADSSKENPSLYNSNYTLTFTSADNFSIVIDTSYKTNTSKINISNVVVGQSNGAAGSTYIPFTFTGYDENNNKFEGDGTLQISNVATKDTIYLSFNIKPNVFNGVDLSNNLTLGLSNNQKVFYSANNTGDILTVIDQNDGCICFDYNHGYNAKTKTYDKTIERVYGYKNSEGVYVAELVQDEIKYEISIKIITESEVEITETYNGVLAFTEHLFK